MKTIRSFAAMAALNVSLAAPIWAANVVIAYSPYESQDELSAQVNETLELLASLEPGDRATLVDGYHLQTLGEFNVPTNPKYRHPKARLALNQQAVGALLRFKSKAMPVGRAGHPSVRGAVKLPQLLAFVANNVKGSEALDVLVLGSVRYDDPREPAFSMAAGKFPSDANLLASRAKTPYGAADNPELLNDVRVHIAHNDVFNQDRLGHYTRRFWTLYIEEALNGQLVSYGGDRTSVLRRLKNKASAQRHDFKIQSDAAKVEMVQLTPPSAGESIFERPLSTQTLREAEISQLESLEIGISWQCARCDIDLHFARHPGGETLYYGHTRSRDGKGRYWKDFLQSPQAINGYETISYQGPLDLNAAVTVINFYSGQSPGGVLGDIRITANGQTYAAPFQLSAEHGRAISVKRRARPRQCAGRDKTHSPS